MVIPALKQGGYQVQTQVNVGKRPTGKRHIADVVAVSGTRAWLISLKWQQESGTAEQKVPYEVISLIKIVQESDGRYAGAYLVLGGPGWSMREYYVSEGLADYIVGARLVNITTFEHFLKVANKGEL